MEEPIMRPHVVLQSMSPRITGSKNFTPLELAQIYNFPKPVSNETVNICVVSFGGGLFGNIDAKGVLTGGDLESYWCQLGLTKFPTVHVVLLNGMTNSPKQHDSATIENHIDVEQIGAIVPNSNITLIIGSNFLDILNTAKSLNTFVISSSWGFRESGSNEWYKNSINNMLKTLSESGINVCCSAGDNGSSDGGTGLNVDFPASSPYVVACGGTSLICPNSKYDSQTQESVWNNNPLTSATGGGRSSFFKKPDYQQYLQGTNRCVPDISGVADPNTCCIFRVGGQDMPAGGTSIVSPFIAAYIALTRCDKFLTPLLYKAPKECFHDVVNGNNGDFLSGPGFDLCTGLGSIDGRLLQSAILSPQAQISPSVLNFIHDHIPQQLTCGSTFSHTWYSSNSLIASVDSNGLVTPMADGTCYISCSLTSQTVLVTVSSTILAISCFVLPILHIGQTIQLGLFNTNPPTATMRTLTWMSQQPDIASINSVGLVTALKPGLVTFVGTLQDANKSQSFCSLQVV
jgi:subtilase family serine protease